jgi:cysteinyl-tRNA synthetase
VYNLIPVKRDSLPRFTTMELKLYDTLTREKRAFKPLDPAHVRMYVCGPTVYDFAHIGNARPVIVFDVLFRLLRHIYGDTHVTYVRNITDVDDKINARAAEEYPSLPLNEAIRKVTEKTDKQFHDDVAALGCLEPTVEPRATEHIAEMRVLIDRLVASGNAYVAEDNVLFSVPSMPDYGQLSKRPLDEMIAGARVDVAPYKKDPQDFILWKPSKPGEPAWPSPAGIKAPGRPGWHIECSAMSWKYLGETFDIHGGGIDLVFPHHENEIAQSRCAFHTPVMANYWMHNGFLQVEGEKMSKSLGNFATIHELLRRYFGGVLRFTMLKTHYREPIDWTRLAMEQSRQEMGLWSDFVHAHKHIQPATKADPAIVECLMNDLDTPNAVTRLRELYKLAQSNASLNLPAFLSSARLLGLAHLDKAGYFRSAIAYYAPKDQEQQAHDANVLAIYARAAAANNLPEAASLFAEIRAKGANVIVTDDGDIRLSFSDRSVDEIVKEKIALRERARARKDWKESDRIRDDLAKMGVVLKDSKDGTTWEIAR